MPFFRKKPIVIEAVQYDWDDETDDGIVMEEAQDNIADFVGENLTVIGEQIEICTLEGVMLASKGDWIIKGIKGEFYPCRNDIFAATYEEATPKE